MSKKVWSEDRLEEHRAGLHDARAALECFPCHIRGIRFNTHTLRFWNNSKDSANDVAAGAVASAKAEGRDLISGSERWI